MFRSAATIALFTMISRVLGFARDMLIASFIGANAMTDAFFVAFKLPNFMRRLFAEGAFNSAFVPIYAGKLAAEGQESAKKFASEAMSVLIVALIAVVILMEIFAPQMMVFLAPGFDDDPGKFELTVALTRITFPYIFFISLVSLYGGILNSVDKFAAVAAAPILMNICFIWSAIFWRDTFETPAHGLSWGVFAAGILQYAWLAYWCKRMDLLPKLQFPRLTVGVRELFRLIGPAAMGAGVVQINLMVDMIIASSVPEGVSYLYYADRINELPLAIIGIAGGTVLLPLLSKQLREGKHDEAIRTQNRAIEMTLLFSLPAAMALIVIAWPIVATLYEHGEFTAQDSFQTYRTLIAFAFGLPAFILVKVLSPGFYANHDTKTPFQIACICVLVNFMLNITLVEPMAQVGMALATTAAGWLNAGMMAMVLYQRKHFSPDAMLKKRVPRLLAAALVMGVLLWATLQVLEPYFHQHMTIRYIALTLLIIVGLGGYGASVVGFGVMSWSQIKQILKKKPVAS